MDLEAFGIMDNAEDLAKKVPELVKQGWSTHRNYAFQPGTVVWAQLQGYPSWPAIVEEDPDCGRFYDRSGSNMQYHVTFLDTVVSRAWISFEHLRPFTVKDTLPFLPKNQSRYRANLKKAFENAKQALSMPLEERLKTFNFVQCHVPKSIDKNVTSFAQKTDAKGSVMKTWNNIKDCAKSHTVNDNHLSVKITSSVNGTHPDNCQLKMAPSINSSRSSQFEKIVEKKMPMISAGPKAVMEENGNVSGDRKQRLRKLDSVPKKFKNEGIENGKRNGSTEENAKYGNKKKIEEVKVETKKEMKEEVITEEESDEEIWIEKNSETVTDRINESRKENVVGTQKINYEIYKMGCCYSKLQ